MNTDYNMVKEALMRGDVVRFRPGIVPKPLDIQWVVSSEADEEGKVGLFGWEGMDGRVCAGCLYRVDVIE